jgi:hypothetical protein
MWDMFPSLEKRRGEICYMPPGLCDKICGLILPPEIVCRLGDQKIIVICCWWRWTCSLARPKARQMGKLDRPQRWLPWYLASSIQVAKNYMKIDVAQFILFLFRSSGLFHWGANSEQTFTSLVHSVNTYKIDVAETCVQLQSSQAYPLSKCTHAQLHRLHCSQLYPRQLTALSCILPPVGFNRRRRGTCKARAASKGASIKSVTR